MKTARFASAALALMLPLTAAAHPGHAHGDLVAGLAHPLGGFDHLLAMLAVGAWAALCGGAARWAMPLAFVAALAAGALLAPWPGFSPGAVEQGIAASVLLLGLLLTGMLRPPLAAGVALVAGFAFFHGLAHGSEAPGGAVGSAYVAGFMLSSLALHAAGLIMARLANPAATLRLAGFGMAAGGVVMLAT